MLSDTNVNLIDQAVANPDAWYPASNLKDWQEPYRVPGDAPKTLERQMLLAMADCNAKLAPWKAELLEAAVAAGDPVPVALPAEHALDYEEAVFARAFGLLVPLLPSVVMDERARDEIDRLQLAPGPYFDRSDARLARITGASLGRGHLQAAVI